MYDAQPYVYDDTTTSASVTHARIRARALGPVTFVQVCMRNSQSLYGAMMVRRVYARCGYASGCSDCNDVWRATGMSASVACGWSDMRQCRAAPCVGAQFVTLTQFTDGSHARRADRRYVVQYGLRASLHARRNAQTVWRIATSADRWITLRRSDRISDTQCWRHVDMR